jgi:hypothetical protein
MHAVVEKSKFLLSCEVSRIYRAVYVCLEDEEGRLYELFKLWMGFVKWPGVRFVSALRLILMVLMVMLLFLSQWLEF